MPEGNHIISVYHLFLKGITNPVTFFTVCTVNLKSSTMTTVDFLIHVLNFSMYTVQSNILLAHSMCVLSLYPGCTNSGGSQYRRG